MRRVPSSVAAAELRGRLPVSEKWETRETGREALRRVEERGRRGEVGWWGGGEVGEAGPRRHVGAVCARARVYVCVCAARAKLSPSGRIAAYDAGGVRERADSAMREGGRDELRDVGFDPSAEGLREPSRNGGFSGSTNGASAS